jgi:replicative DNA helicase
MGIPTAQLQIKEFPTGTCSAMMIKQYLKKLKEVKGFIPDLIVLDYLNIAKPNAGGSSMNMYEKGKSVAEELRAISGEFHIPLISAIQSNRGGYSSQDIDMDNASESGGIPATADCMFGVFQLDGEREANKINLKVIKNRYGGFIGDTIPLEVDYNTLQLKDWNEDYDEEDDDNSITSIQHDKDELDKALDEL